MDVRPQLVDQLSIWIYAVLEAAFLDECEVEYLVLTEQRAPVDLRAFFVPLAPDRTTVRERVAETEAAENIRVEARPPLECPEEVRHLPREPQPRERQVFTPADFFLQKYPGVGVVRPSFRSCSRWYERAR